MHNRCTSYAYALVILACSAQPASADLSGVGAACAAFMRDDPAAFEGWTASPCDGDFCSQMVETTLWSGAGALEGWAAQAGAPTEGPVAGQRRCELAILPEENLARFEEDVAVWVAGELANGTLWQEDRFTFGCGIDDVAYTVGSYKLDDVAAFSMSLVPGMHDPCNGRGTP